MFYYAIVFERVYSFAAYYNNNLLSDFHHKYYC
jgi:hypothetical protein